MRKSKISIKVSKMDLCQTPGCAVEPLLKVVNHDDIPIRIWEPAIGEGYLARALESGVLGSIVYGTDVEEDFLSFEDLYHEQIGSIITNPPFTLKKEFAHKALEFHRSTGVNVALLMQTEVVSTKWFYDLTKDDECGIIWFHPRINFKMPEKGWAGKGSHFSTAWFTWGWFTGNRFVEMNWSKDYRKGFET